jgi:ABC-2 type transport system permease protein
MKGYRALLRFGLIEFVRDRLTLFWTLAFPILFMVVFGLLFTGDGEDSVQVGFVPVAADPAVTEEVRALLDANDSLDLEQMDLTAALHGLDDGDLHAVVDVQTPVGSRPQVNLYYDPSRQFVEQVALPLLKDTLNPLAASAADPDAFDLREQPQGGTRDIRPIDYVHPGILAAAIMQLGLFAAVPLVALRENKILKRMSTTPLRKTTIVAAQVSQRLIIALIQSAILILLGWVLFDVRITGEWQGVLGILVLGAVTFVAIGYAVAALASTQEAALPIVNLISFPMLFLSGTFFPIELMPKILQVIVAFFPLTYLVDAMRQILVDAAGDHSVGFDVLVLIGWTIVALAIAARRFRWT